MPIEIERKFLVNRDFRTFATKKIQIIQGYLSSIPERTVRIRIWAKKAFLTIKGKTNSSGTSRFEWEKEITPDEALELLDLCEPGVIRKSRYIIPADHNLVFEVDEFYGDNEGLILAEIELPQEDLPFKKPEWLGKEVTNIPRYYNAALVKHPYKTW